MARAGSGSHGGGRSGGGHSSGRSSGGHRIGGSGSSRAGSRSSGYSSGFGGSSYRPRTNWSRGPSWHGGGYVPFRTSRRQPVQLGCGVSLVIVLLVLFVLVAAFSGSREANIPASTANRQKVDTGVAYQNDCIIDELGWFDNISSTERKLQKFYDKTGIQPFIYLRAYDPALATDREKLDFAQAWYEEHIHNEGTFLYVYFAEADQDGQVGYMCYVNGKQITSVMDAEAVDIFWAYLDNVWYSDMSTDELFVSAFTNTAQRIMEKSTTGMDVVKWIVIFVGAAVALALVLKVMKTKRAHEKQANEETERILNTPLDTKSPEEELADQYLGGNSE